LHKKIVLSILASGILLADNTVNIEKITVTGASKSEQSLKSVTSNIEVVTAEEIEEKHYTTITQALSSLTGINFTQSGGVGTTTNIYMQGMDTKYILVLVDGVRYNDLSSADGSAQLEHLLLSDVERIELIKGANPIWGADAAAGVVNIVTKKAAKGFKSSADLMYGSYNTKSAAASFGYGADNYSLSGGISRYMTDGFSAQAPRGSKGDDFERDGYQNTSANIKAGYELTQNLKVDGEIYTTRGTSNYDAYLSPNSIQRISYEDTIKKATVSYRTESQSLSIQASETGSKKDDMDTSFGVKIFKSNVKNYELKDDYKYAHFGNLTLGASKEEIDIRYTKIASQEVKKEDETRSVFAANTISGFGLTLTQAIRYDDYSTFGSKTNAKAGAKYTVTDDSSISANYATAFKAPTILQMANPWGASNFDLKPENIRSFDVSATYKRLSLTYFYNTVSNLINWSGSGYANLDGTSILQGYEAKYSFSPSELLAINIAYTRLKAEDASRKELQRRAHDTININVDYYPTAKLHIGLYSTYIGTRYDTNTKATQTGGYALFNSVANYAVNKTVSFYGKFENMLDRYYQTVAGYATPGRSVYAGVKAYF
jgi:vitamin B12 transporter